MEINMEDLQNFIESRLSEILDELDIDEDSVTVSEAVVIANKLADELIHQYGIFTKLSSQ